MVNERDGLKTGYLIFPFYPSGTLQDRIERHGVQNTVLPLSDVVRWIRDICAALMVFHSMQPEPLAFRDLKVRFLIYFYW